MWFASTTSLAVLKNLVTSTRRLGKKLRRRTQQPSTWDCSLALTEGRERRPCGTEAGGSPTLTSRPSVSRSNRGRQLQLSYWLPVYDWMQHNGFNNFNSWIA